MTDQPQVNVIYLGETAEKSWSLGTVHQVNPEPEALTEALACLPKEYPADVWLFWSDLAGDWPAVETVLDILSGPGQIWHGGLRFGLQGQPHLLDSIRPIWMLNRDVDPSIESTSWRLSFYAALIRQDVIEVLGPSLPDVECLEAAGLEYGYRAVNYGVLPRYVPTLTPVEQPPVSLSLADQLRILRPYTARLWLWWALMRRVWQKHAGLLDVFTAYQNTRRASRPCAKMYQLPRSKMTVNLEPMTVGVLIPTIDRYPYLRILLDNLRHQTCPPHEIVVVDQTEATKRDLNLQADFSDLPLRILYQDVAGQSSSRNAGLKTIQSDYVLFVDDDVEVPPDFIEHHLRNIHEFNVDVSSGTVYELPQTAADVTTNRIRAGDVFPAGNTLIRREVLFKSGLFDLAYERKARADGDLGMRIYIAGGTMICDETSPILHHHAPVSGLRTHKARAVTRLSSRQSLTQRNLLSDSNVYLGWRYFTNEQVDEMCAITLLTTMSSKGSVWQRVLRFFVGLGLLPHSIRLLRKRRAQAAEMLNEFPQIGQLSE